MPPTKRSKIITTLKKSTATEIATEEAETMVTMDEQIKQLLGSRHNIRPKCVEINDRATLESWLESYTMHPIRSLKEQSAAIVNRFKAEEAKESVMKQIEKKILDNQAVLGQIYQDEIIENITTLDLNLLPDCLLKQADLINVSKNLCCNYIQSLRMELKNPDIIEFNRVSSPFPSLTELAISSVCDPIAISCHFLQNKYPQLQSIELHTVRCTDFILDLPELRSLSFNHSELSRRANESFGQSISECPKLITITGYKLWGLGVGKQRLAHRLVLPSLENFVLDRSDDLDHLIFLYAPKLKDVTVTSCYSLRGFYLLNHLHTSDKWLKDSYPNVHNKIKDGYFPQMPETLSRYVVDIHNSGFDPLPSSTRFKGNRSEVGNILSSKRCKKIFTKDPLGMFDEHTYPGYDEGSDSEDGTDDNGIIDINPDVKEYTCEECPEDEDVVRKVKTLNEELRMYPNFDSGDEYDSESDSEHSVLYYEDEEEFYMEDLEDGEEGED